MSVCILDFEINKSVGKVAAPQILWVASVDFFPFATHWMLLTLGTRTSLTCHLTTLAGSLNKPSDSTETRWLSWSTQQSECNVCTLHFAQPRFCCISQGSSPLMQIWACWVSGCSYKSLTFGIWCAGHRGVQQCNSITSVTRFLFAFLKSCFYCHANTKGHSSCSMHAGSFRFCSLLSLHNCVKLKHRLLCRLFSP